MKIKSIYGVFNVNEPVLLELLKSKPLQRLKKISHQGTLKHKGIKLYYSRFEHSVGVMLLLRKFGAGVEEQAAGLLHDVSHTAFSHSSDMLFGDYEVQGFQDSLHLKRVNSVEIKKILKKHCLKPERIGNPELFKLLETKAPDLCADRLDYSLRDLHHLNFKISSIVKHLTIHKGEFVFDSEKHALLYAKKYFYLQTKFYSSKRDMINVKMLTTALKSALDNKIITRKDVIHGVDFELIKKIENSKDGFAKNLLKALREKNYKVVDSSKGIILKAKFRYVDPKIFDGNSTSKLSEFYPPYKKTIEKVRRKCAEGFKVKIISNDKVIL